MQEYGSAVDAVVLVPDHEVRGVQGAGVLHGRGGVETAGADHVDLLNHDGDREGGALGLEEAELVLFDFRGGVLSRFHDGRGCGDEGERGERGK